MSSSRSAPSTFAAFAMSVASVALCSLLVPGCSAFPDVTYDDEDPATSTAPGSIASADASANPGATLDASAADASTPTDPPPTDPPPTDPPDAAPGGTCPKDPCVGSACGVGNTCQRCKDACKGQTKKCCANADPATSGGVALSCIAENAKCPGEAP